MRFCNVTSTGLLSSVAEGRSSLSTEVEKLPFDLQRVIKTGFDITKPQPQLYVCESFDQLIDAVNEFASTMAFMVGGTESLDKALRSNHIATFEFSSGLQLTGTLTTVMKDVLGEAIYIKTEGPSALAYESSEIKGHSKETHHDGFGSPIGKLKNTAAPLEDLTDEELSTIDVEIGQESILNFESGVQVSGIPTQFLRKDGKVIVISFTNCTVTLNGETLFHPTWGSYDMAVGEKITSVFAGAADSEQFFSDLEEAEQPPLVKKELTPLEQLYGNVRSLRENGHNPKKLEEELLDVINTLTSEFHEDWLLRIEILELLIKHNLLLEKQEILLNQLEEIKKLNEEYPVLIQRGLMLASK